LKASRLDNLSLFKGMITGALGFFLVGNKAYHLISHLPDSISFLSSTCEQKINKDL